MLLWFFLISTIFSHCTQKLQVPSILILLISPITLMAALLLQTAWQLLMAELTAINGQGFTCCSKCYSWYDCKTEMRICRLRPLEYPSLSLYSNTGLLCKIIHYCGFRLPLFVHLCFLLWTQENVASNTKLRKQPSDFASSNQTRKITLSLQDLLCHYNVRWRRRREKRCFRCLSRFPCIPWRGLCWRAAMHAAAHGGTRGMFPGESSSPCRNRLILNEEEEREALRSSYGQTTVSNSPPPCSTPGKGRVAEVEELRMKRWS